MPSSRIQISPINISNIYRPTWSVMIPTHNCASYLCKTLTGVLNQDMGVEKMQIEVIDDHSTKDNPEEIVRNVAGNRVAFYRQPQNKGHNGNFETCLNRAHGKYVHLLHGDDIVIPDYYKRVQKIFE